MKKVESSFVFWKFKENNCDLNLKKEFSSVQPTKILQN